MNHNVAEVAALQPDYLGFIFYDKSPRDFENREISIPTSSKKVGVFVDASIDFIIDKIEQYNLSIIQLHGNESPEYCKKLLEKQPTVKLWKVFSIKDHFDFTILSNYDNIVSKFLFDTKGKAKGGNGYTFDWDILKDYPSATPFILSGGIGLEHIPAIKNICNTNLPIYAIDVNSKFEDAPGLKNISELKRLIDKINY